MLYFKKLDLDITDAVNNLQLFCQNYPLLISKVWNTIDRNLIDVKIPELPKLFRKINLTVKNASILVLPNTDKTIIHRDTDDDKLRINLPVINCGDAITKFYKTDSQGELTVLHGFLNSIRIDPNQCTEVAEYVLDCATVMRVTEPHRVIFLNKQERPRISCGVRFEEDIEYLLK